MNRQTEPTADHAVRRTSILNEPYGEPRQYWKMGDDGRCTNEEEEGRRSAGEHVYWSRKLIETSRARMTYARIEKIRGEVKQWREKGWPGISDAVIRLLEYWKDPGENTGRPFFCQIDAVETLIWLEKIAPTTTTGQRLRKEINKENEEWNLGIPRLCTKMATGTGKTWAMAMLMLWKATEEHDCHFLVMTPGLTVRDRVQELNPDLDGVINIFNRPDVSLQPPGTALPRFTVTIENWHKFRPRQWRFATMQEGQSIAGPERALLVRDENELSNAHEDEDDAIGRVLDGRHGKQAKFWIINDEGHHCHHRPSVDGRPSRDTDWHKTLRSLHSSGRLRQVFDFSATPIWPPTGNREQEDIVFPWTVSDYPLIEAVEAGLVKVPQVPLDETKPSLKIRRHIGESGDDLRNIYKTVRETGGHVKLEVGVDCSPQNLPPLLRVAAEMLQREYSSRTVKRYKKIGQTPVFCIVTNDIANARALFRWIAGGYDNEQERWLKGQFDAFSNVENGKPKDHPPTMLVHTKIGKEGDDNVDKQVQRDMRQFFGKPEDDGARRNPLPDRIRDIFNTVGQSGKPGERIRCIVSVDMLSEGWDCRTVSTMLGFRAFNSKLLTEQVAGRALRRSTYEVGNDGRFHEEQADILGIPFDWMPTGDGSEPAREPNPTYLCAPQENRTNKRITFPIVSDYRIQRATIKIRLKMSGIRRFQLSSARPPEETEVGGLGPEVRTLTAESSNAERDVALWKIAERALKKFHEKQNSNKPEMLGIGRRRTMAELIQVARRWASHPKVDCPSPRLIVQTEDGLDAAAQHLLECCQSSLKDRSLIAEWPEDPSQRSRTTGIPAFRSSLPRPWPMPERVGKPINAERNVAPCHTKPEARIAKALDGLHFIDAWARTHMLGFEIPYRDPRSGRRRRYIPDFVVRTPNGNHVVVEYKGMGPAFDDDLEEAKQRAVKDEWVPAVSGSNETFSGKKWDYLYVTDLSSFILDLRVKIEALDGKDYSDPKVAIQKVKATQGRNAK